MKHRDADADAGRRGDGSDAHGGGSTQENRCGQGDAEDALEDVNAGQLSADGDASHVRDAAAFRVR